MNKTEKEIERHNKALEKLHKSQSKKLFKIVKFLKSIIKIFDSR